MTVKEGRDPAPIILSQHTARPFECNHIASPLSIFGRIALYMVLERCISTVPHLSDAESSRPVYSPAFMHSMVIQVLCQIFT